MLSFSSSYHSFSYLHSEGSQVFKDIATRLLLLMMTSTSIPHRWKYDVFVSFRGEDIRKSFMDHLFKDFRQKGIRSFRDDNDLPRGEVISPELYKAIEESKFLLVIFSKNYASSSWCLRELVKILECKQIKDHKHEVRIIFYDVKPAVVRKQTESYAKAFMEHESTNRTEVAKWREALSMAADLSGWDLPDMTNGYESKFIDSISKKILQILHRGPLHVGENLVGVYARVDKLNLFDFVGSNKVHIIGICGIRGIGKTTFAKAIYNKLYVHFEECSFCEDVEGTVNRDGLAQVQTQVIEDITKIRETRVSNVSQGVMEMKRAVASKRILLVLDNVEHSEQIDALAGSPCWFFPGSLIILTCKDKQLLSFYKADEVDEIFDMRYLDDDEALELFSLHAFGEKLPTAEFKELTYQVVQYIQGHPLALKVLGRFLSNKTTSEWKSELGKLQVYPNADIQKVLRLSFDGLDFNQKRIFLDIACAFIGEDKDIIASMLDTCNGYADTNIRVLADKFLITIDSSEKLQMHDLIQRMAREVVREESNMPGKQSRLWINTKVLKEIEATEAIEVLVLLLKKAGEGVPIDGKGFTRMKNLRILKVCYRNAFLRENFKLDYDPQALFLEDFKVNYTGRLEFLSNKLIFLCWHGFPFKFLPSNFYPEDIVVLDLSYSRIKNLWKKSKCFRRLKVMKLRHCRNLTSTPDFTEITNLEKLYLDDCVNLVKVHPSIRMLKSLVILSMRNCSRVKSFQCIFEIESLQVMDLSGWSKVDRVDGTTMKEHSSFVSSLRNRKVSSFGRYVRTGSRQWTLISRPSCIFSKLQHRQSLVIPSLAGLCFLRKLDFSYCNILQVPDSIGGLSCLTKLYLKGNNFSSLPGSLSQLTLLQYLYVDDCKKLEMLPGFPPKIRIVSAADCTSLHEVQTPLVRNHDDNVIEYFLRGCSKLLRNVNINESESKVRISQPQDLDTCITSHGSRNRASSFLTDFVKGCLHKNFRKHYVGPKKLSMEVRGCRGGIPKWFTNQSKGGDDDIKVELPQSYKLRGFATWVTLNENFKTRIFKLSIRCKLKIADGAYFQDFYCIAPFGGCYIAGDDKTWLYYTTDISGCEEAKDFVTFSIFNNEEYEVKEWGVRLICEEEEEDIDMGFLTSMMEGHPIQDGKLWMKMGPTSLTASSQEYVEDDYTGILVKW